MVQPHSVHSALRFMLAIAVCAAACGGMLAVHLRMLRGRWPVMWRCLAFAGVAGSAGFLVPGFLYLLNTMPGAWIPWELFAPARIMSSPAARPVVATTIFAEFAVRALAAAGGFFACATLLRHTAPEARLTPASAGWAACAAAAMLACVAQSRLALSYGTVWRVFSRAGLDEALARGPGLPDTRLALQAVVITVAGSLAGVGISMLLARLSPKARSPLARTICAALGAGCVFVICWMGFFDAVTVHVH